MFNANKTYLCPFYSGNPMHNPDNMYNAYKMYTYPYCVNTPAYGSGFPNQFPYEPVHFSGKMKHGGSIKLMDYGSDPFTVNIEEAARQNNAFRIALWTGKHLQVTLMSIKPGEDIGLEAHPGTDQFIRVEQGQGLVKMGDRKDKLDFQEEVCDDYAIVIPAGKWHNLINTGCIPLKLYSIYAPPEHPHGTVHETKADAEAAEKRHRR
jgi:mannose-6-phosphate isomerase-like protein (cupin superfamily)